MHQVAKFSPFEKSMNGVFFGLTFAMFFVSRFWMQRASYSHDAQSNHIIGTTATALLAFDIIVVTDIVEMGFETFEIVTKMLPNLLLFKFVLAVALSHDRTRGHISHSPPFDKIRRLWSVRSARSVAAAEASFVRNPS